jgi:hypothetical protein
MEPYYRSVLSALAGEAKKAKGVQHDTDPKDPKNDGKDVWLPGLFVIDEIFQALYNDTWNKCVAFNNNLANGKGNTDLAKFVNAISVGKTGLQEDADKYIPFINYTGEAKGKTYIKLIFSQDKYIVGGLIHVHDWKSGTHSNGTGYP